MEVLNINDKIRNLLSKYIIYDDIISGKDKDFNNVKTTKIYNWLKENNIFNYAAGVLFITCYMVSSFVCRDSADEDEKENLEFLKSFNSLEEFILMLDEETFAQMCTDISYFVSLDLFSKKQLINHSLNEKEFLKNIFPCYFFEILYYLNPIDSKELLNYYYENYKHINDKNVALEDTICQGVDDLIELERQDFDSYKYIILDMIEVYYKYNIYLLSNDFEVDEYSSVIVEMVESDLNKFIYSTISNVAVLEPLVRGYLECNILPKEEKQKIEEFYKVNSNKSKLAKVLKKSNDLKKKN